jgi:hypothetical protein
MRCVVHGAVLPRRAAEAVEMDAQNASATARPALKGAAGSSNKVTMATHPRKETRSLSR